MSLESIVRKTLNLIDHKIDHIEERNEGIYIHLDKKNNRLLPCNCCETRSRPRDRLKERTWRHVPLWGIPVFIVYRPTRVHCENCSGIKVEKMPWSRGKSNLGLPLIMVLSIFARLLPWEEVARQYKVSWGTVRSAVQNAVEYGLLHRDLSKVRLIGIDEISRKKGHLYHTNVYDLEAKTLLWSGEGRKSDTLVKFFDEMGEDFAKNLDGICCDMWDPYVSVIRERAPQAVLVFDKFHIIRHLLDAVDTVRKQELKILELHDDEKTPLKGTKYIWLKNPWNLTPNQKRALGYLMKMNLKISKAYLLKEAFREFWSYEMSDDAKKYLDQWFWWATHSRIDPMRNFAWMLRRHEQDILSWFKVPINNGAVEAMNNNAKEISHRARGYRTEKTFTLAMLHCMGGLQLPETTHRFM